MGILGIFYGKTKQKVIIIGSGPAGYTAALYLARAGYTPLVIAGALTPGGQLMNTTEVENYPGFVDGILGPDLMEAMQKQAEKFGAQIILNDVVSVDFKDDLKTVTTDDGETYTANAVIISTGSQVRKLGVPGEQEYPDEVFHIVQLVMDSSLEENQSL